MRLLLLSNSTQFGHGYLDHAEAVVRDHLDGVSRLLFVPFALHDRDGYAAKARDRFGQWGVEVDSLHDAADPAGAIGVAEAVFVGGGNSFRLLKTLQDRGLLGVLRRRVREGMPYMGASAGSNLACPTIRTSNDMPIVEPAGFDALGLLPFQLNPHYLDPVSDSEHMGETREQRLREFLEDNDTIVLGLREGGWLVRRDDVLRLEGPKPARLFRPGLDPREIDSPADISDLLRRQA